MVFPSHIHCISSPWCNHSLDIIKLIILVIIHLLLHMVMVNVVWFIEPSAFPPIKIIFGLMVDIMWHEVVGIIPP